MKTVARAASIAALVAVTAPAYALQECRPSTPTHPAPSAKLASVAGAAVAGAGNATKPDNSTRLSTKDARICFVNYDPDNVLRVWGTLRSMTMLVFGPKETNPRIAAADSKDLIFIPDGNIGIIKPKPVPSAAWHIQPIVILTTLEDGSVRPYLIEYNLLDEGPITADSDVTQFKIQYLYPGDAAKAAAAAWRARQASWSEQQARRRLASVGPGAAAGSPGNPYCDYVEQHDPRHPLPFIPTKVCDDGQATYLYFPGNMPVPTITVDGPDGKPMVPMQNFDSVGSYQVVHQLARHFYLRIGDALDCIWRTGPVDPVGNNPGTHTSSPTVTRVLREAAP